MKKIGLVPRLIIAITLGIVLGLVLPSPVIRIFVTFSSLFSKYLSFVIPFMIIGFVVTGISDLRQGAGKLLGITTLIAYLSTIIAGTFAFLTAEAVLPNILANATLQSFKNPEDLLLKPFIEFKMTPIFDVTTALIISFILGIGISATQSEGLKQGFADFGEIIEKLLATVIIPLLPFYILGVFMNITASGEVFKILKIFALVFVLIIVLHFIIIAIQYTVAGSMNKKNPFKMLVKILPAYMTAIGTQSSAATIPVTLKSTKNMGVDKNIANFTIPLFATIHLSGSTITLTTCASAVYWLQHGASFPSAVVMVKFILLLGVTMVAAPGVPGGAVMAALGLLQSVLGFNEIMLSLMIALYITQDSFGTACNISGDGALSAIVDRLNRVFFKKDNQEA